MARPSLAIICNSVPPYRVHVHQRIVRELPWLKLWTVCTHDGMFNPWEHHPPAEINPVDFGARGDGGRQGMSFGSYLKGGRVIRWLREQQVSAVVINGYNDPGRLRIFRWCAAHGVPCFLWGDSNIKGDFATGTRLRIKKRLLGWIMRRVAGVLACGSLGAAYFQRYGAPPTNIFYFPNEPDYPLFETIDSDRVESGLKKLGLDAARRRIVFSGRMVVEKRIELLIDCFARFAEQRPQWDLVIVGDGALRPALEARVSGALRSRIIFTGFIADPQTVAALYRGSDVMALPSVFEPWALVINEATAAGMAIVCTDVVGAAAELVIDGVNGYRVPADQTQLFAEALLKATDAAQIDALKRASSAILAEWRKTADPIDGLKKALEHAGITADSE